jgi:hypothetical protein
MTATWRFAKPADQFGAVDFKNTRRAMGVVGPDRDLPALPGAGIDTDILQCHRQKARGHLLAGGND